MFLLVKKGTSIIMGLQSTESVLAAVYASIREEYNDLELDLDFNRPNVNVFTNVVRFIKELDKVTCDDSDNILYGKEEELEACQSKEDFDDIILDSDDYNQDNIDLELSQNDILENTEISEPLDFEEMLDDITDEKLVESNSIIVDEEAVVLEKLAVKPANSPGERLMESLKEEQKNEGIIDLEGDKVNTLVYRDHLINYMKLGFASNLLMKKAQDCNDTAEKARLFTYCEALDKRTDEFELKFKEIGLTTGQIHTFRMEVLREVRKYRNDSVREVCDYVNKLYATSDDLLTTLK